MIFVECEPDKALLKALGIPRKEIEHAFSKGNVCNRLAKSSNAKGLVDEDPLSAQPGYLNHLTVRANEHHVKQLFDEKRNNHLVVICPRLEDWILKAAHEAGTNFGEYGLPSNSSQLHRIINTRVPVLINLVKAIRANSRMLATLEGFVKHP